MHSTIKTIKKKNQILQNQINKKFQNGGNKFKNGDLLIHLILLIVQGDRLETIKPQYAVQRLYELTKNKDTYITTEVGQHQMWAAQHYKFDKPNRWMTSGGLGTMGYGLPAAVGVQVAHPNKLVIDIAWRSISFNDYARNVYCSSI